MAPNAFKRFFRRAARLFRKTPTRVIEKSPDNVEREWYKKPRRLPVRVSSSASEMADFVEVSRPPLPLERTIHTHVLRPWEETIIVPSVSDIHQLLERASKGTSKTDIVAIKKGGKVLGYSFIRLKKDREGKRFSRKQKRLKERLRPLAWEESKVARGHASEVLKNSSALVEAKADFQRNYPALAKYYSILRSSPGIPLSEYAKIVRNMQKELDRNGIQLRFVPDKKAGYALKDYEFAKR